MNSLRLKPLLLFNLIAVLLFTSFFWPITKVYWIYLDIAFFKAINSTLQDRPLWQLFWACANHKLADWIEDLFILGFFILYVVRSPPILRLKKICQLLFLVLFSSLIIYFVNQLFFRENFNILRPSPTLTLDNTVRLSQEIPWMRIKDSSPKSFPADHGTTALLFAAGLSYVAGKRFGIAASLYAAFLCMPRLITGAHWLSDVLVGSGTIVLICLSWAFCTPLYTEFTRLCECFFLWIKKILKVRHGQV